MHGNQITKRRADALALHTGFMREMHGDGGCACGLKAGRASPVRSISRHAPQFAQKVAVQRSKAKPGVQSSAAQHGPATHHTIENGAHGHGARLKS